MSYSRASYDSHVKKESYRRAGVLEYVVWRTRDGEIDWFRLEDGNYVKVEPDEAGGYDSTVVPGLPLEAGRLLAGEESVVLPQAQQTKTES